MLNICLHRALVVTERKRRHRRSYRTSSHVVDSLLSKTVRTERYFPGWNEQVKELHDAARHAYLTWRDIGKPRQGGVFIMMKLSRSKFKYAL